MGSVAHNSSQERRPSIEPGTVEVEVIEFKKFDRGALRGWVDLIIQPIGLKFNGVAFFQKDGKEWLKLPQREFEVNSLPSLSSSIKPRMNEFRREGGEL